MRLKIYYRKNLKLSPQKLAAQCGHVAKELGRMITSNPRQDIIIVLGVSCKKFKELALQHQVEGVLWYQQEDIGLTEVEAGTITCFGYVEEK